MATLTIPYGKEIWSAPSLTFPLLGLCLRCRIMAYLPEELSSLNEVAAVVGTCDRPAGNASTPTLHPTSDRLFAH